MSWFLVLVGYLLSVRNLALIYSNIYPQDLFAVLSGFAPQVLNDISQPQGSIPEGFKTYVLAIVSIFMLLYLLKSHLPSKTRMFLLGVVAAFAFLVHIETTLAFFFVFLPAYVLLK